MSLLVFRTAQPKRWTLCFGPSDRAWLDRLVPGRFKHVRAYGYVPLEKIWIFLDCGIAGMTLRAVRDDSVTADVLMRAWTDGCELVQVEPRPANFLLPGLYCVGVVKRLVGIRCGALLPDGLYRHCLKNGGRIFNDESATSASGPACPARSGT